MNTVPHDVSKTTKRKPPMAWVRKPEPPDFTPPERQPARPAEECPPTDEPGYGHGV